MANIVYTLQCKVVDEDLKPVRNRKLTLFCNNVKFITHKTNSDGTIIHNDDQIRGIYEKETKAFSVEVQRCKHCNINSLNKRDDHMPNGTEVKVLSINVSVEKRKYLGLF